MDDKDQPTTKVEESHTPPPNAEQTAQLAEKEADADLLSLDSLDEAINEADPEFSSGLGEIGPDDPSAMYIYDPDLELTQTLEDVIRYWEKSDGVQKILYKMFPFIPKLIFNSRNFKVVFREKKEKLRERIIELRRNGPRELLTAIKGLKTKVTHAIGAWLGQGLATFKSFSIVKKILFVLLLLVTGVSIALLYRIATKGLVGKPESLFMTSMEALGQKTYRFDPGTELEPFYDSLRASQNMLSLEKMIVNLRPSESSGSNPMGAFEFFVEGMAADVIIEIKDREPEIRDLFQRTIEEYTFDLIASGEGKQQLNEKLRKDVNKVLTTGRVRRVFIKTAIIKP